MNHDQLRIINSRTLYFVSKVMDLCCFLIAALTVQLAVSYLGTWAYHLSKHMLYILRIYFNAGHSITPTTFEGGTSII